jgi:hypothetical protein
MNETRLLLLGLLTHQTKIGTAHLAQSCREILLRFKNAAANSMPNVISVVAEDSQFLKLGYLIKTFLYLT